MACPPPTHTHTHTKCLSMLPLCFSVSVSLCLCLCLCLCLSLSLTHTHTHTHTHTCTHTQVCTSPKACFPGRIFIRIQPVTLHNGFCLPGHMQNPQCIAMNSVHVCHQIMKVSVCRLVFRPHGHSSPGFSVRGILQAKYWSGLPFPSPGELPNPGNEPESPALTGRFFTA